ncbi:DNA polymerase III subunit gamma/tau [Desulfoprunum benzoelyticum]|uniref:DNA polymerase III subunit gamma/tau n=1 Tax=Desulfoprunum benzoelyticum TaxID=1506996 RepID=A0A840UTL1_9BACT|nr:DNA polymerase III subunit gamma/tau [Desulfoprunum benzoelyticum]MBB5349015.1 DNA polymerase-3 subunit gamma/tau [Desulfoprunum benzoelyticum]MBM9530508.1 DNA polymerase III subunit gamma/tau [Desulfoprunum benzoelyticum]
MSYLVLARKSRPQTFAEVVGQRPVVKTLQNSLSRGRVAHAILFSGVRGVGKTTLARLMAKAVNCEGETDQPPCNRCRSCLEITAGNSLDLHEIDGASNRGIQEIRELKDRIRFLPTSSRFKIIIIDEVHMLTTEAFNALLKTLEEPPAHVYFMFATTELHKIPVTILSRCQQYELKRVPAAELSAHFRRLAEAEGFEIEAAALALIVREAEGSVRDGLSLLDQVFSFGEQLIRTEDVIEVLGLVDRQALMRLTAALLDGDRSAALTTLDEIYAYGLDIKRFSADLMDYFRTLILCKIPGCDQLLDLPGEELATFQETAHRYTLETLHQKLNLLMQAVEEIRHSSQPRLALEISFLKIIEAGNVVAVTTLLGHLEQLLGHEPAAAEAPPQPATAPPAAASSPPPDIARQAPAVAPSAPVAAPEPAPAPPQPEVGPDAVQAAPPPPPPVAAPAGDSSPGDVPPSPPAATPIEVRPHEKDIRRDWLDFVKYVHGHKVWMAQDLQRADSVRQVDKEVRLHYNDPANCAFLRRKDNRRLLTEYALDFFQKEIKILFIVPDQQDNADDAAAETPQSKRQQLAGDPLVIMTAEIFRGQVGDIRIGQQSR